MSEKQEKLGAGRAAMLACVAVAALVTACDARLPTEVGDVIDEVIEVQAREARGGVPADRTQESNDGYLAKWFVSDPPPLVFANDVRVGRYEDLPESVRLWSESGLTTDGLIDRVEVIGGPKSREIYGEEGASGAIRIFTKDRPVGEEIGEAVAESPADSDRANLWGGKFSGMIKGVAAVMLYGKEAAGGVILVYTKK